MHRRRPAFTSLNSHSLSDHGNADDPLQKKFDRISLKKETGMDNSEDVKSAGAEFWQCGGARVGAESPIARINLTWPFATLTADADKLVVVLVGFIYFEFRKNSLVRLSRYEGLFSKGLRIEHVARGAPAFIVFWTFDYDALAAALEAVSKLVVQASSRLSNAPTSNRACRSFS
jgi:hypothetical protein